VGEDPIITWHDLDEIGDVSAASKMDAFADFGPDKMVAKRLTIPMTRRASRKSTRASAWIGRCTSRRVSWLAWSAARACRAICIASPMSPRHAASMAKGAPHASDIPYFLGRLSAKYGTSADDEDHEMARIAHQYVVKLAGHGDP